METHKMCSHELEAPNRHRLIYNASLLEYISFLPQSFL